MIIEAKQLIGGNEVFQIEIGSDKVAPLMELFEGDFVYLGNNLKIMDYRMVLVNPKFQKPGTGKSDDVKEPLNESISEVQSVDEALEAKVKDSELPSDSD